MQTCSRCNAQSPDTIDACPGCGADLKVFSTTAVALQKFLDNPRVAMINVISFEDSCPACQAIQGTYPKDQAPKLPVEGCSHENGCRCFYQPFLGEIFP